MIQVTLHHKQWGQDTFKNTNSKRMQKAPARLLAKFDCLRLLLCYSKLATGASFDKNTDFDPTQHLKILAATCDMYTWQAATECTKQELVTQL